jgi:hypothetical protein
MTNEIKTTAKQNVHLRNAVSGKATPMPVSSGTKMALAGLIEKVTVLDGEAVVTCGKGKANYKLTPAGVAHVAALDAPAVAAA